MTTARFAFLVFLVTVLSIFSVFFSIGAFEINQCCGDQCTCSEYVPDHHDADPQHIRSVGDGMIANGPSSE